jgi:hypothetical protein
MSLKVGNVSAFLVNIDGIYAFKYVINFWNVKMALRYKLQTGGDSGSVCPRQANFVLALAILDNTTEIEIMLSVSCHPKWPRQVQSL